MKGKTGKGCSMCGKMKCACGGKVKMAKGGGVKVRGCGAATKGTRARGPMA
jgi:hypothetical protein